MSNNENPFKRNKEITVSSNESEDFINKAEDGYKSGVDIIEKFSKKEITFPLTAKHAGLLEKIWGYHNKDISRRKLGAKALAYGIEAEAERLGITISNIELN